MPARISLKQAEQLGLTAPAPPKMGSHEWTVAQFSDRALEGTIAELSKRNLRDQSDHETRWCAARLSAARAERRQRKALAQTPPAP